MPRVGIDFELARVQHRLYDKTLNELGCKVFSLAADPQFPDSVFVEDTAIVLDEIAIIARPGVASRQPETASIARTLGEYRQLKFIEPPGTLEGGDVLRLGKMLYVGLSGRTNESGTDQLRSFVAPYGYSVKLVEVSGCLHLKSAVTQIGPDLLLINPEWVSKAHFKHAGFIEIDPEEPFAANGLLVGTTVIYPGSFPRTKRRMEEQGVTVAEIDISELQKAEGAVTCCSLVFTAPPDISVLRRS